MPDVDRLRRAEGAMTAVVNHILAHRNSGRPLQRNEREVRQVDLVDLVEDLLPRGRARR